LLSVGEQTASRLISVHNVRWTIRLCEQIRTAIVTGEFDTLRHDILRVWA